MLAHVEGQMSGHIEGQAGLAGDITVSEETQAAHSMIPRYAWVILVVVFLASVAAPLNQFKVPPLMPVLIKNFELDLTTAGLLMSVFAIMGLLLAIPAGFLLQRFGPKRTGLAALGFLALGSGLGALSNTAGMLLGSRLIEGIGMGLIAVVAPAAIALWFPAEKRGMPMGLWATWVPVGSVITYAGGPILATAFGWQAVWWAGAGFALLILGLYWLLFRGPTADEQAVAAPSLAADAVAAPDLGKAMANPNIWLLSLEFLSFNLAVLALNTFYPTFLTSVRNYTLVDASFTASLTMFGTIFSAPIGGWISDRIGSRKRVIILPFIALTLAFLLPFRVTGWQIPVLAMLIGLVGGAIPAVTFATVPEVMPRPSLAGIGMAVLAVGQNLGMFLGPLVFGKMLETMSWVTAGYLLIPVCLVGIGAAWLIKVR